MNNSEPTLDPPPPYSEDAEQAVLSAMLMDPDAILRATEFLDDTMFYREGHRRIFRAMLALSERGDVVDPLTLSEELSRSGLARIERRQGLHRISRRRGSHRGKRRVPRQDRS